MYRGTTPTIYIKSNVDLTGWDVEVAVKKWPKTLLVFDGDDVHIEAAEEGCLIYVHLSQEQTLSLRAGSTAQIQLRAYNNGTAIASNIAEVEVDDILRDGIIGGE